MECFKNIQKVLPHLKTHRRGTPLGGARPGYNWNVKKIKRLIKELNPGELLLLLFFWVPRAGPVFYILRYKVFFF